MIEPLSDADFKRITLRALDKMGLPSIGHVMVRVAGLEQALAEAQQTCQFWMEKFNEANKELRELDEEVEEARRFCRCCEDYHD